MTDDATSKMMKMNALKKVAVFDGSAEIERWIDWMEFAIEIDDVPDNQKATVLSSNLDGPAYEVWKGMEKKDQKDAEKIKGVVFSA